MRYRIFSWCMLDPDGRRILTLLIRAACEPFHKTPGKTNKSVQIVSFRFRCSPSHTPVETPFAIRHKWKLTMLRGPRAEQRSGLGQTLPSDSRTANDCSRRVSGSPSVGSRAAAECREPPLVDPRAADRVRSELTLMTAPPGEPHRRKADAQIVCDRAVTIWLETSRAGCASCYTRMGRSRTCPSIR